MMSEFSIDRARELIGDISENASETCRTETLGDELAFAYAVNHLIPLAERAEELEAKILVLETCIPALNDTVTDLENANRLLRENLEVRDVELSEAVRRVRCARHAPMRAKRA